MKKTVCAACGETGGRFVLRGEKWYHAGTCTVVKVRGALSTFPFTTNHFEPNDGPVTVQNMRHLRQLENRFGVHSEVYNNNENYQGGKY
jgi:hypothetical protein